MSVCGPSITKTTLPADAWYPFPINVFWIRFILYTLQILAILHTGLCIAVDYMIAMMFWYCTARLEMLGNKIKSVLSSYKLGLCVEEHQKLIM